MCNTLISVVIPCLNESRTIASCIERARQGCEIALKLYADSNEGSEGSFQVVVADNGSEDDSRKISKGLGADVVQISQRGYGAAILGGIKASRGKYCMMGDADSSYDFLDIPRLYYQLCKGYDLVLGNRFAGGIESGAMPWLHRYVGNPVLSGVGQLLYQTPCRDWHCGLRGFDRDRIRQLNLQCSGMEFASEMVIAAAQAKLRISEIPIKLYRDGRDRRSHLRSFRDGWRHLQLLLHRFVFRPSDINVSP